MADLGIKNNRVAYLDGETVVYNLPTQNPFGNEAYTNFSTSTSFNPSGAFTHGSFLEAESGGDIEVSLTVSEGKSKILVTLDASVINQTDATTEINIALERNGTAIKSFLFPVGNTFFGSQYFQYIDTHGGSAGDTITYKLKVDMSDYSNESARIQYGICGDTFGAREV